MSDEQENSAALRKLERNSRGELVAHLAGRDEPVANVTVAQCFPWTVRDRLISVRDKEGKELVLLRGLDAIDPASREIIQDELRDKFFVPKVRRILDYNAEFGVVSISAETDRGEVMFQIRNRDDVRLLSPVRALFRDVDGNVYEVEDFSALDRSSRRDLEQFF